MSVWLLPHGPLSDPARALRRRWAERWQGTNPVYRDNPPDGVRWDHRDAYPEFRCPLSREEERQASVEFHRDAIGRLTGTETSIVIVTIDWEWIYHDDGETGYSPSSLAGALERDPWLSMNSDPDVEDETRIAHLFMSQVAPTDPRLNQVWQKTVADDELVVITNPRLDWLAWPIEQHLNLLALDSGPLDRVQEVERETWARWGIADSRQPLLDLAEVAAYFEGRRAEWEHKGVQVMMGPHYRCFDGDDITILTELPPDLSNTDWFFIRLASATAQADVIVYDTGTCTVHGGVDTGDEAEDEALESLIGHEHGHAGELDLPGVTAVLERVAGTLAAMAAGPQD